MSSLLQKLSAAEREKAKKRSMPDWMEPMLAKLTHDYFSNEDWIYERKLDGQRVITYVEPGGKVLLMSRNNKQLNATYPEIEEALTSQASHSCILDGEVVAFDEEGISDFQTLQPCMQTSSREESKASGVRIFYYVFDCLYIEGHDITGCALRSRKELLREALKWDDPLRFTPHHSGDGLEFYKEACEKGWEGLIAKRADSRYLHSRSSNWLKFKCSMGQEFVICGFTEPHGERVGFGALLLGFYQYRDLVYAGQVGTGFDDQTLKELRARLERIERKTSPYDRGDPQTKETHFVTPKLVCQVAFSEWTKDEKLRHPRFKGLRRDKEPEEVHKEGQSQAADL